MRTISIVVFCLFVGLAVGHPSTRTNHRKPERPGNVKKSARNGRRPQMRELTEGQSEKLFFCHMANKACRLVEDGEEPLVDRTCYNEAACDGPSGTISLDGTDYTITFCKRPEEEMDDHERILRLNRERTEPNKALHRICKPQRKNSVKSSILPERKQRWFHRACKVSYGDEDLHRRECKGEATCTKGPYDAELNGKDVEVTFCDTKEKEEENKGDGKKDKPFWYEESCQVTDGENTLKEDDCPADLECIIRLSDMEYDSKRVDAGYCGGFLLRHRRSGGAHGGRQHSGRRGGFKGRLMGHGRRKSRGESKGQHGSERKRQSHGSRREKSDRKRPNKRQGKSHQQYL